MQKTRGVTQGSLCACGHLQCLKKVGSLNAESKKLIERAERAIGAKQPNPTSVLKQLRILCATLEKEMQELDKYKKEYTRGVAEYYKREVINSAIKREAPIKRYTFEEVREDQLSGGPSKKKKRKRKNAEKKRKKV